MAEEKHIQAERDYMLGMKYKDIADKHGVTINTVKSWKNRHGWKRVSKKGAHKEEESVHTKAENKQVHNVPAIIVKNDDELTEKQKLFCQFFVNNRNATQAAIRAGYSKDTAKEIGYENLTKPHIRAEVDRLKKLVQQALMLDPNDIVERYMRMAFADMTDVAEWGTELIPDIDKSGKMQIDNNGNVKMRRYSYLDFKNSDQVDGGLICEISLTIEGLEAGTYTFTAALSGYTSASTDVVVTEDVDSTGTIALTATITSTIVSAVATAAASTLAEKIAALKVKLNAKITASHSWAKLGYLVLSALLDTGSEWALNYVASKIK